MDERVISIISRSLYDSPDSGLSVSGTPEERLALVATLTREAWALAGLVIPAYERANSPVSVRSLHATRPPGGK